MEECNAFHTIQKDLIAYAYYAGTEMKWIKWRLVRLIDQELLYRAAGHKRQYMNGISFHLPGSIFPNQCLHFALSYIGTKK